MYKGITDPKVEKDVLTYVKLFKAFAKTYADKKFLKNASTLQKALSDWNTLQEKTSPLALWYLMLEKRLDETDKDLQAIVNRLTDIYMKGTKEIVFFSSSISKLDPKKQAVFLKDKKLAPYKYLLQTLFKQGKYTLSDAEEKIMIEKNAVAHEAWTQFMDSYISEQTVRYGKKTIPLSEGLSIKADLPRVERRVLHKDVMEAYKKISFVAEAELNAVVRDNMINSDIRGYKTPYEATVLQYQNDLKTVESLVDVVTKANPICHKFFELKSKILNKIEDSADTKLTVADITTGISTSKKVRRDIPFDEAVSIVRNAFNETDPEFAEIFDEYVERGQIDVYPKQGKRSGAFCWSQVGADRTFVFLNYTGKLDNLSTIAHEMGHAFHYDLSKSQPAIYRDFTTSVAEVASTFFENILFDKMLETADEDEKRDLLLNNVQDRAMIIFGQIAYFQFEKKLHAAVREKGYVKKEEMAAMFAEARRSYLGDAVEVSEDDGYAYVYIGHFRMFFYVYSYAYGQLIADALYAEYKKDKKFIEKIKKFLRAGGSMSPADIFKSIGIDTTKPDFFKKGLKKLSDDLDKVSKLV